MQSSRSNAEPKAPGSGRLTLLLSSVFYLGYLPKAPGTFGTLGAIPLWYLLHGVSWSLQLAVVVFFTLFAVVVSDRAERLYGGHDNQRIVIDEVAGLLWATLGVPFGPQTLVVAFVLFRLLDALKPGPIGWVDTHIGGGRGVVLDDVAAGIVTLVILWGVFAALGAWP